MRRTETTFLETALLGDKGIWDSAGILALSGLNVPDGILGRRRELLRGDVNFEWANWFAEGIADPLRYVNNPAPYSQIYSDVLAAIQTKMNAFTATEAKEAAKVVSDALFATVGRLKRSQKRHHFSKADKTTLLGLAGNPPRCWICGATFSSQTIDAFLESGQGSITPPLLLDVLRGKGLQQRDFWVEIDHVLPFSRGGADADNLRLSCGWCNRHKRDYGSIYDVQGSIRNVPPNKVGLTSLPQPFWAIRLLAMVRHCEHPAGCHRTSADSELTIAGDLLGGSMNPSNLRVICLDHDPLGGKRFQPVAVVRALWERRIK